MINKVALNTNNKTYATDRSSNTSFKGVGDALLSAIQVCERNPMLNVAVLDFSTAIIPRTAVESKTNGHAGFEAFRRESSGLLINCMIPGFVALGFGKLFNNHIIGKKSDLSSCWAGTKTIDTLAGVYNSTEGDCRTKVKESYKKILTNLTGIDGKNEKMFKEISGLNIENTAEKLTEHVFNPKASGKELDSIYRSVADATSITEHISLKDAEGNVTKLDGNLKSLFKDSSKFFKGVAKEGLTENSKVMDYASKAKKLVGAKSLAALAVILPLAASMQYINRKITAKRSGEDGAPIYDDYAKKQTTEQEVYKEKFTPKTKNKDGLLRQKFISIGTMVGVALLSMMKKPSLSNLKEMMQFKGQFPTMDQARAISTVTFASRMAVADDKNELAEATLRDVATFSSFYFLGDYAAKATASLLEKKNNITLLNRTKELPKDAGILKKIGNWVVNTSMKSSDELATTKAKNLRGACQLANLGASLILLGILIPLYGRHQTKVKHERDKKFQNEMQNYAINNNLTMQSK